MSGIVFVHRKGMDFKVRHGLYIEKGHDLLVQAWSLYIERAWFINSSIVPSHHSVFHSCLFINCLGSHQDVCLSGIVCTHPQIILNPTDKRPNSFFHFHYCLKTIFQFSLSLVMDHLVLGVTLTASFDNWPYLSVFYPVT